MTTTPIPTNLAPRRILVTGDYVHDRHIYEGKRRHYSDRSVGVKMVSELGGAHLVARLLDHLLADTNAGFHDPTQHAEVVPGVDLPDEETLKAGTGIPDEWHAYAFWKPEDEIEGKKDGRQVWRVAEAMGFGGDRSKEPARELWPNNRDLGEDADMVVLCDGGLGFRSAKDAWPQEALRCARTIVLKTGAPLHGGALFHHLLNEGLASKLTVVVSASELRKSAARIGSGLSWEDTIETLADELNTNPELADLKRCHRFIVTFESEGALLIERGIDDSGMEKARCQFVYNASCIEGAQRHATKGAAFGFLSCMAAAVAFGLMRNADRSTPPDLARAMEGGLSAMWDLLAHGHGDAREAGGGFPAVRLAQAIKKVTCTYARAEFDLADVVARDTDATAGGWSLLGTALRVGGASVEVSSANVFAERLAVYGRIAIDSVPHLCVGKLVSVERREIESMRVISQLIHDYKRQCVAAKAKGAEKGSKPLSIGIFGPPGSGKSFSVKQIALHLLDENGWKEFNLSQFDGPEDLIAAFHAIRDINLSGLIPVVFFDEFDSQKLKWLQYLLAPMQDGRFQDNQGSHPLGACVLFFAGGTSWTYETFGPTDTEPPNPEYRDFVLAKGPDFKSRLDGFLNVSGPNQRERFDCYEHGRPDSADPSDIFYPVRRALMIRAELKCDVYSHLDIDAGALQALITVDKYKHGSRSLSKILEPMKRQHTLAPKERLWRSLLPPRELIGLHTTPLCGDKSFLSRLQLQVHKAQSNPLDDGKRRERVAEAVHDTWQRLGVQEGWKSPGSEEAFNDLDPFMKESNLAAALRMPEVLALACLALDEGKNSEEEMTKVRCRLEYYLELLAKAEHDGWMAWHSSQGWTYGRKKDVAKREHPCLKPYRELSDEERNKDRDAIRHYLDFAERAGLRIVPIS